ncbi:hypothetical protein MW728_000512 [Acinetobacter baumannii]|uniref:hypothetical protein n=1 Tax=Acinetobacter nosocomialis TaxID=106654 RepID=UPI0005EB510E|nr:hypothetical protein [Acinetobacter nosocomialis]
MKLTLAILCCFFSTLIFAKPVNPVSAESHEKNCRMLMEMAEGVMEAKQNGMSLSQALNINDETQEKLKNKSMHKLMQLIIIDAYKQPSYSTPSIKKEQLNEFSAKYYLGCSEMYR